jgi:hypothetical protein
MNYSTSIDEPASSAETACIKKQVNAESKIKRHDLQIIGGNSQAEAMAATRMNVDTE